MNNKYTDKLIKMKRKEIENEPKEERQKAENISEFKCKGKTISHHTHMHTQLIQQLSMTDHNCLFLQSQRGIKKSGTDKLINCKYKFISRKNRHI